MAKQLIKKGNKCLEERENIPSAPLWHFGKVYLFNSKKSFDLLQNTVSYLSCRAQQKRGFTENEKEFMVELFESFYWGGKFRGYSEAAKLADHYVNGDGKTIRINSEVYTESVIVSDTILALKYYIREISSKKKSIAIVKTTDYGFRASKYSRSLRVKGRNIKRQGYMKSNGILLAEQSNQRLQKTDNQFYLVVKTTRIGNKFYSFWKVENKYDFQPFAKNYITDIPISSQFILKVPDGLSHYLVKIGTAKEFKYSAEWKENWTTNIAGDAVNKILKKW